MCYGHWSSAQSPDALFPFQLPQGEDLALNLCEAGWRLSPQPAPCQLFSCLDFTSPVWSGCSLETHASLRSTVLHFCPSSAPPHHPCFLDRSKELLSLNKVLYWKFYCLFKVHFKNQVPVLCEFFAKIIFKWLKNHLDFFFFQIIFSQSLNIRKGCPNFGCNYCIQVLVTSFIHF